jgi:hypothetical protein
LLLLLGVGAHLENSMPTSILDSVEVVVLSEIWWGQQNMQSASAEGGLEDQAVRLLLAKAWQEVGFR